jgi:hypothetical protein
LGNESKPTCHRKRVPLAEAFRIAGIDEHKIAEGHVEVYGELTSARRKKPESAVKLILEVLKEWTRIIVPPPRNADRALLSDAPSTVELVHTVARPARVTRDTENRILDGGNLEAGSVTSETASAAEGVR